MKGSIYCIRTHKNTNIYIGSTTQKLCNRMSGHRASYKKWLSGSNKYTTSYEILKYGDAYIELIIDVEYDNKQDLFKIEGKYIREMECVNKMIAGRTTNEWVIDNKEYHTKKCAEYYIANKDIIKQTSKKYSLEHSSTIKEKKKEYYNKNYDDIQAKLKEYRIKNRDILNEKQRLRRSKNIGLK